MRKFLFLLLIVVVAGSLSAQTPESALTGVVMGTASYNWEPAELNDYWGGGLKVGFITSLDGGIKFRALYSQLDFGLSKSKSLETSVLLDWYAGRLWTFYLNLGADNYVGGDFTGTDPFAGVGFSRELWSSKSDEWEYPPLVKAYAELLWVDTEDELNDGNYAQVNLGFTFSKPQKK